MRVELQDVRKSHRLPQGGFVTPLAGIDLLVESGSTTLLCGHSGCGKTSLLNIMGGLAVPTSGTVLLDGVPQRGSGGQGTACGFAFQEQVFVAELTVMENLLLPVVRCRERAAAVIRGEQLLEYFGLAERFDFYPAALSWGEKRRLNLARAVLPTPRLLLLDEATAGLDDAWQEKTMELLLRQVRDTRATLVMASVEPLPCAAGWRQIRMQKGRVREDGNSDY